MTDQRTRRRFLAAAATATVAGAAGCAALDGDGDGSDGSDGADGTTTAPPTTGEGGGYELHDGPAFDDPSETVDGVETFRGVGYATAPETDLLLDLHRPADADGPAPLLVHVHGGGWAVGNRRWDREGRRHARLGAAAATVDYRLSGEATYPAAVRDVVAAVTWLRREAADGAGIDPDRVVLIGESAGAHLAALVGNAGDLANFQPPGVDGAAGEVDGVVGISGIYHLTTEATDDEGLTNQFFGCTGSECPEAYREGSPATHVEAAPPTLLYHGTDDDVVPYRASTMYRDDLQETGVPVELITGDGGAHVTPYQDPWGDRMRAAQREFLGEHLELDLTSATTTA